MPRNARSLAREIDPRETTEIRVPGAGTAELASTTTSPVARMVPTPPRLPWMVTRPLTKTTSSMTALVNVWFPCNVRSAIAWSSEAVASRGKATDGAPSLFVPVTVPGPVILPTAEASPSIRTPEAVLTSPFEWTSPATWVPSTIWIRSPAITAYR